MPIPNDLTTDELEGLDISESCSCSICRLGREVIRRRRQAAAIDGHVAKLGDMARDVSVESRFPGLSNEILKLEATCQGAEGKVE